MDNKFKKLNIKDLGPGKILLLALAGVFLIVTSLPWKNQKRNIPDTSSVTKETDTKNSENEEYIRNLENRLEQILRSVEGVGKVEVMITLKSSGETILNKDISQEETEQEESEGNMIKSSSGRKEGEETVLADHEGNRAPYVVKQTVPEISGVLVICEGAGSNRVASSVMEAASVVFGVPPDRIRILKMEEGQ